MASPGRNTIKQVLFPALMFLVCSAVYLSTAADQLGDYGGDATHYIMLGQKIAQDFSYVDPVYPGSFHHTKYPFVFPALLAPVTALFGADMLLIRVWVALIAVAGFVAWWLYYRGELGPRGSSFLVFMLALHPYSVSFVTRTLSETPFLLFTGVCLSALSRWRPAAKGPFFWVIIASAVLAYFTRTAGVALFASLFMSFIVSKKLRRARAAGTPALVIIIAAACVSVGGWSWYVLSHPSPVYNYFYEFGHAIRSTGEPLDAASILERVSANAGYYSMQVPMRLIPLFEQGSAFYMAAAPLTWALIIFGCALALRRGMLTEGLYTMVYAAMIMLWPPHLDFRFFYPLMPLFLVFIWLALCEVAGFLPAPGQKLVPGAVVALILLAYVIRTSSVIVSQHIEDPYPAHTTIMFGHKISRPVADWSNTFYAHWTSKNKKAVGEFLVLHQIAGPRLPRGAVLASAKPSNTAFFTGNPAVYIPPALQPEAAIEYFSSWEVEYVFVDRFSQYTMDTMAPLLKSHPHLFTKVVGDPGRMAPAIYRFNRPRP